MKAFIDCGAYNGKILQRVLSSSRYGAEYKAFAFECNPALSRVDYGVGVTVFRKAVWVSDGEIKFFINKDHPTIEGNSIYQEKTTGNLDKKNPITVKTIDFSSWISKTFTKLDYVVCKMNIEGAEYDVLERCVEMGTIELISELHIQWHVSKIPGIRDRHNKLIAMLNELEKPKLYTGYGVLKSR
jgi:FkbM family methyltransferase